MRKTKTVWVYGKEGYGESKWFKVCRRDYKIHLGRGYGSFGEYNNTLVVENKNDCAYESIICEGPFANARTWKELYALSAIYSILNGLEDENKQEDSK